MFKMAKRLEDLGIKSLQVFPLRTSLVPKYIPLDTCSLIGIFFKDEKPSELLKKVRDNRYKIWNTLFNLRHKILKINYINLIIEY